MDNRRLSGARARRQLFAARSTFVYRVSVRDADCAELLRWAAARLDLRYEGFRRVRGQVCKRLVRRIVALGLGGPAAYRAFVDAHPAERAVLDELCRVHVSRFYRDRALFDALASQVLPTLASRARGPLRVWSAGCAAGEEPYTLALIWRYAVAPRFPGLRLQIVATDVDGPSLDRARLACYPPSSLKELPPAWREAMFVARGPRLCLRDDLRDAVELRCEDVRERTPAGPFHLILCRNGPFTYFAAPLQRTVAARVAALLAAGGGLIIGYRERLPAGAPQLVADPGVRGLYWVPGYDTTVF
jgi:chemotaxis protein methyltransferase CheR